LGWIQLTPIRLSRKDRSQGTDYHDYCKNPR
jgi:hypothetical protein